jgi:hypothetical protein
VTGTVSNLPHIQKKRVVASVRTGIFDRDVAIDPMKLAAEFHRNPFSDGSIALCINADGAVEVSDTPFASRSWSRKHQQQGQQGRNENDGRVSAKF